MSTHDAHVERPLGGKLFTPAFQVLLALVAVMVAIVVYRLFAGLGAVQAANDGYPWGIWKPLNVVTFTGIAAGAYGVGIITYVFNRGRYHPLVRSAIMAGAMGYTLAGTSVLVDLGRWWNLWIVFWPPVYNLTSVLLEVAICVLAYTVVLWVELAPVILEKLAQGRQPRLAALARRGLPVVKGLLPFIIALAILLPTMHQSSLGSMFMVAVTKLHPFWHSPWLPALFLTSCLTMGYGAVVLIEATTAAVWPRQADWRLLARIGRVAGWIQVGYLAVRLLDLWGSGNLAKGLRQPDPAFYLSFLAAEILLFGVSTAMFLSARQRANPGRLFLASMLAVAGGTLYRFDTYLVGFRPRAGWHYFPSVPEILVSVGFAAAGIAVYVVMVKRFPLLSGVLVAGADSPSARGPAAAAHR